MAIVAQKLLTAEEFLLLPDNGMQQELVRGEVIEMPPPAALHGVTQTKAILRIGNFVEAGPGGTLTCESGVITRRDPDSVRGPDIAYWCKGRLREIPVGYVEIPPDLIVEILSPSNTTRQILEKLCEYFAKGVRLVWVISPEDRTLTIYRKSDEGRLLHETAVVTGEEVLPGFECKVSDLLP